MEHQQRGSFPRLGLHGRLDRRVHRCLQDRRQRRRQAEPGPGLQHYRDHDLAPQLIYDYAQAFTTGSNSTGYTLTSVGLGMDFGTNRSTFTVAVHASSSGAPGASLGTLSAPGTLANGTNTFTHDGLDLDPTTTYFVVIDTTTQGGFAGSRIRATTSDDEEGATGWSISNAGHFRDWDSTGAWTAGSTDAYKIGVNGVAKPNPALVSNITETTTSLRS